MAVQLIAFRWARIRVENIHEDKRIKNIQVTDNGWAGLEQQPGRCFGSGLYGGIYQDQKRAERRVSIQGPGWPVDIHPTELS